MMRPRDFLLRLALCQGIGIVGKYRLWQNASDTYQFDDLAKVANQSGLSLKAQTALFNNWTSPLLDQAVALNKGQAFITILDDQYPQLLRETYCPPIVLFYRGNLTLLSDPILAVVGSRQMTTYGKAVLHGLIPTVVKHRLTIVSGLARGIDSTAQELALTYGGRTIGVIGTGLDQAYPRENQRLQAAVAHDGLLISEYPLGTPPLAWHFPERNRLIAGLCQTCLVVEGKKKSGSLITSNIALQENRNVCAVPGRIDAPLSVGCNELIAAGAKPVLSANDLLSEFQFPLK
nr:DNA-processing protein DprA [Limosilactobacillus difficilis]